MAVSQGLPDDGFGGLTPHQLGTLYEPILLESALHKVKAFPAYSDESENQPAGTFEAEMSDREAFCFYVNKLAQICDNNRGSRTISAIAILQGSAGPNYVIGSNSKDKKGLKRTKDFVQELLDLVGKNPEKMQDKPLEKRVLWFILYFHRSRLLGYLQNLILALQECQRSCERRQEEKESEPLKTLIYLSSKCQLEIDVSDTNRENKSLSDCETLIKAIHNTNQTEISTEISQRAKDAEMTRSEPWCKLRHYLGRWLSYRKAAQGIVAISQRWSNLFLDFEITMVPSGSLWEMPDLPSGLTSSIIVQHIVAEEKGQESELAQLADSLEQMGIDDFIRESAISEKFRPKLHAEVLVYEYLSTNGQTAAECYWNGWSYIGSSKPTCRLCNYYFEAIQDDRPSVRPSHGNVYRNWRLPEHHDSKTRDEILNKITQRLRANLIRTLKEKKLRRKEQDSNTQSSFPKALRNEDHTPGSTDSEGRESPDSTHGEDGSSGESEGVTSPMD